MVTCVLLRGSATLNDVFYLKEDLSDDEADVFAFKNIITGEVYVFIINKDGLWYKDYKAQRSADEMKLLDLEVYSL